MPEIQPSLLFNRYSFTDEEKEQIKNIVKTPLIQAYIQHTISGEVQTHLLSQITAALTDKNLRDQEMFTKGVIQTGIALLDGDVEDGSV